MRVKSLRLCLTLCDPTGHSLPGSSVCGILQASILEWVAMPFSRGSSPPRDRTSISYFSFTGRLFTTGATWEAPPIGQGFSANEILEMEIESFGESHPLGRGVGKSRALRDAEPRRMGVPQVYGQQSFKTPHPQRPWPHRVQSGFSQMSSVSPAQQMEQ